MKSYISPTYLMAKSENGFLDILGVSLEIVPEDNSVIITQEAENIFG